MFSSTIIRGIHATIITILIVSAFFYGALFFVIHNHVIDFSILSYHNVGKPSLLLDDEGNEWGRFHLDRRDPIDGIALPHHLIDAFLAAEVWDFFRHNGISYRGFLRSIVVNIYPER